MSASPADVRRLEHDRAELLAKYAAVHEAINDVREDSPGHFPDHEHLLSNSCYRCGVEWLADTILDRMASAVPTDWTRPVSSGVDQ